jgi:hypothetical protein
MGSRTRRRMMRLKEREKNDPTSTGDWAEYGNTMRSQEVSWGEFSTNVRVRGDGKLAGYKKK